MGLYLPSAAAAKRPGVFPIDVKAPTVIDGVSTGRVGYPCQAPWGDVQVAYEPTSINIRDRCSFLLE